MDHNSTIRVRLPMKDLIKDMNNISIEDENNSSAMLDNRITSSSPILMMDDYNNQGKNDRNNSLMGSCGGSSGGSGGGGGGGCGAGGGYSARLSEQGNQNAVVLSTEEALLKLSNRTKYPIVQENGQRCYGPPPEWEGPAPERGCEVFVGKIPRDCFEDELVPIFESVGPIYMFRLMMDFNGSNRGYGFCMYTSRDHAKMAVTKIDNYEIRTDKILGVCQSVDNCRLFVGGIPKTKTKEEIFVEMNKVTECVRDVIVYPSAADKTKNRGFAFVEYDSHKAAAMARRKLIPGRIHLWGQQIAVDWAEPEREVDETIMSTVRVLYVRNLMLTTSEDTLREAFNKACDAGDAIERVKKMRDYAFIHFRERKQAELAMRRMHNSDVETSRIEVSWAKPVDKSDAAARNSVKLESKSQSISLLPTSPPMVSVPVYFDPMLYSNMYATNQTALDPNLISPSGNNNNRANGTGRSNRVYRNAAGSRSAGSKSNINSASREKKASEILEEVCIKNNWGTPMFAIAPQDVVDPSTGQTGTYHLGQVTIPGLNQNFIAPTMSMTPEDAKQTASKSILSYLNIPMLSTVNEMPGNNTRNAYQIPNVPYDYHSSSLGAYSTGNSIMSPQCTNIMNSGSLMSYNGVSNMTPMMIPTQAAVNHTVNSNGNPDGNSYAMPMNMVDSMSQHYAHPSTVQYVNSASVPYQPMTMNMMPSTGGSPDQNPMYYDPGNGMMSSGMPANYFITANGNGNCTGRY